MFKSNVKYLGFNDFWFFIIGVVVLGFLIPQIFFGLKFDTPGYSFPMEWLEASLYSIFYWTFCRAVMIHYRKRFPAFDQAEKRIVFVIITVILILPFVGILATQSINLLFDVCTLPNVTHPTLVQGLGAAYTASFFILGIYETIWYYSRLKKSIQEQERVKVAHVHSQLDGLRNQVNPHFLFNSLNTLNHIVEYEDKAVAKNFIGQLSKVYRYILDSREEPTIILEEELAFVHAYVAIQKERFLENLKVSIDVPQQYIHKKIIPLSLQLLIENAIKHNIISTKKPLSISITIDEEKELIKVINTLQKKSNVMHSTKVGLENITKRYELLSEEKSVTIQELKDTFQVSLPLL